MILSQRKGMILFLKFKQQGQLLFLDRNTDVTVDPKQKYFILLSPSLYWVKKVTLPLKYVHEVKKIAATLFEEVLPKGNYNYYVVKEDEDFLVFAYQDSMLLSLIADKGIALNQISGISFAQFVFNDLDQALKIDEENVLTQENGMVVILPSLWFEDAKRLDTTLLEAPKQRIHLEQFSHIVDSKTLYKIVVLLLFFAGLLIAEYTYFLQEKNQIESAKDQLFSHYKLKPTLMQNRAILAKYKKHDQKAQKLRTYIDYFLKAHYGKSEKISSIDYDGTTLKVTLEGVKERDIQRLLTRFYKEKIKINTSKKADKLIVEVKI